MHLFTSLSTIFAITAAAIICLAYHDCAVAVSNVPEQFSLHEQQKRQRKVHKVFQYPQNGENHNVRAEQTAQQGHIESSKKCKMDGNFADCSNLEIKDVAELRELVPPNITGLDLSFNNLSKIPDNGFEYFTRLQWLNISKNRLENLSNNSFINLRTLKILNLQSNCLSMRPGRFPGGVFKPLVSLEILWINNNTQNLDVDDIYPEDALSYLTTLRSLYMDGLPNQIFGKGFGKMTSLVKLTLHGDIKGYCNLISLPANMFTNLTSLTHLTLRSCQINGTQVESDIFLPLKKLTYLDLSHNDELRFEPLAAVLTPIREYKTLKTLKITNVINPYSPGVCVTTNFTQSLPRYLEELNATSNSLEIFQEGALLHLPRTLKNVDIGSNRFLFWEYLKDLGSLINLKNLTVSGGAIYDLPWYYPPVIHESSKCGGPTVFSRAREKTKARPLQLLGNCDQGHIQQPLPPKLERLYVINWGLSNHLTKFCFNETNTLKYLNLDSNNFPKLEGPILGLNRLEYLSMQECKIVTILPTFFQNFTSLKYLNLHSNYFGQYIFQPGSPFVFSKLTQLILLDISFTDITVMANGALYGLNLEKLFLQENPLERFDVDISNMTNLMYVNFSKTNLKGLNPSTTGALDVIYVKSTNLTIDFNVTTLSCICSNMAFLEWTTTTHVHLNSTYITCSFIDGTMKSVSSLDEVYHNLKRECATNTGLFGSVASLTLVLVILIIMVIVYRFRWKLRYLYYSAILHYRELQNNNDGDDSFEFDVFISYAHEDHDFVVDKLHPILESEGMKVHIHGLHFLAGEYISSNIVYAVRSSRRTLVVVTQSHVDSKWCKFEVEMANLEQVRRGRNVLIFLSKEDVPNMTAMMLYHIKNNTYLEFPRLNEEDNEQGVMEAFWSKLVSDLQRGVPSKKCNSNDEDNELLSP